MVDGSMNGKTNDPPGGYSMEAVTRGLLFVLPVHTLATSGKCLERAMHCPAGKLMQT